MVDGYNCTCAAGYDGENCENGNTVLFLIFTYHGYYMKINLLYEIPIEHLINFIVPTIIVIFTGLRKNLVGKWFSDNLGIVECDLEKISNSLQCIQLRTDYFFSLIVHGDDIFCRNAINTVCPDGVGHYNNDKIEFGPESHLEDKWRRFTNLQAKKSGSTKLTKYLFYHTIY